MSAETLTSQIGAHDMSAVSAKKLDSLIRRFGGCLRVLDSKRCFLAGNDFVHEKMSATRSIEILHGLVHRDILSVVVQPLQACTSKVPILKWKRVDNQKEILAASVLLQKEPMRLLREDQNGLWLLR